MVIFSHSSPTLATGNVGIFGVGIGAMICSFTLFSRSLTSAVEGWLGEIREEWQMSLDSIAQVWFSFCRLSLLLWPTQTGLLCCLCNKCPNADSIECHMYIKFFVNNLGLWLSAPSYT